MTQKTVLISEDDIHVAAVLARMLRAGGYGVITDLTSSVVQMAAAQQPCLIVLDLVQPTDGRILLGQLKREQATAKIPVMVLTGVDHPLSRQFCTALGANDYVLKPIDVDLLRRIGSLSGGAPPSAPQP